MTSHAAEKIRIFNYTKNQYEEVEKIIKTDAEWQKILTPQQFEITRRKGTEPRFCAIKQSAKSGTYKCVSCGTDLFRTETKFESGTGWPSFFNPVAPENIVEEEDDSLFMVRTEILCARCGAHLGHVFDDGPPPTGKRFCINSVALKFEEDKK